MPDGTDDLDAHKRRAAEAAIERFVHSETVIGLGSGSTAAHFIDLLGEAIRAGRLRNIRGVATSESSAKLAHNAGIALADPGDVTACDVVVDGADEVSPELDLVKGLGGALLREKIVAQASKRRVIIVDESKVVDRLGMRSPLPVEVVGWSREWSSKFLQDETGGRPSLRLGEDGEAYFTDTGNVIFDVQFDPDRGITDPNRLDHVLRRRAGIVETGLFLAMADVVLVAHADGVRTLERAL